MNVKQYGFKSKDFIKYRNLIEHDKMILGEFLNESTQSCYVICALPGKKFQIIHYWRHTISDFNHRILITTRSKFLITLLLILYIPSFFSSWDKSHWLLKP